LEHIKALSAVSLVRQEQAMKRARPTLATKDDEPQSWAFRKLHRTSLSRLARACGLAGAIGAAGALVGGCDSSGPSPSNGVPGPGDAGVSTDDGSLDSASAPGDAEASSPSDVGPPPAGPCSSLPGTIVYIESGDTQENLLKRLGRDLRDKANITIAFNLTGSCTLTSDLYTGATIAANATLKYIPSTAENPSWTASQPEATCTTGAHGAPIDVGISALLVQSCGLGGPPVGSNLALIQGPNQAYAFVVPSASDQTAIWAEEAYYAFGFGNGNPLGPPWNNDKFLFIRPTTKSTLVATALNIGVPPAKWKGTSEAASSDVVNAVTSSSMPEATIGILGAEVYDGDRGKGIKMLAFQAFGQKTAYYPDSTSTAFDKQNLRDGHYTLWSPTVYITKVDANNVPTSPAVKYITDLVLGDPAASPPAGGTAFDGLADVVGVGLIPQCAMQVSRSRDGGDLSPYASAAPCTCYYMSNVPGASGIPAGCTVCSSSADCGEGGGACIHGFCEPDGAIPPAPADGGATCYGGAPTTHAQIINSCTGAQGIAKTVVLPGDGGLLPLP
jgi:hypothetical protein